MGLSGRLRRVLGMRIRDRMVVVVRVVRGWGLIGVH